jgi:hypothetical protein
MAGDEQPHRHQAQFEAAVGSIGTSVEDHPVAKR